jgi:hypothetical protein
LAALVEHALFDDLVRPQQQRLRDREAERLGDDELELSRLLDGQFDGLGTFQDSVDAFSSAQNSQMVVFPAKVHRRHFGRPGNGEKCDACEEILRTAALMLEVYPPTNDTRIVRFHGDCYAIWNGERHAPKS